MPHTGGIAREGSYAGTPAISYRRAIAGVHERIVGGHEIIHG
jgi:hypothetical protein